MDQETKRGTITTIYHKGYGFISQENGTEIFFHKTGVCNTDFNDLREGFEVDYLVSSSPRGTKAIGIVIL
ncbi:MAG: cold-shock protein [Peptostreptococcaceae bacterium]|nr:cold-shock protein [Peptostreptococcaceae bacterium]